MFHIVIHAFPDPNKEQDEEAQGAPGAYVSCFIDFEEVEGAEILARHYVKAAGWIPLECEKPTISTPESCTVGEASGLEYFEQAKEFGYCLSFHLYPPEKKRRPADCQETGEAKENRDGEPGWYGAKTLYLHNDLTERHGKPSYEERVVLFWAEDFTQAIDLAETEANEYIDGLCATYLGFVNIFHSFMEEPGSGTEVYSIIRNIEMDQEEYINHFYDDGSFRTQT